MSITTSRGGGIIDPGAPTVSITRGMLGGIPVPLAGTSANPPSIFTWLENPFISGTHWSAGETITIHLFGPLNSLGVTPTDLILPTFFPTGPTVADNAGNFTRVIIIPNGQRPGNYLLHAIGPNQNPPAQRHDASVQINICPQTVPRGEIQWAKSRGGRDGQLGDISPERIDPEWISAWNEQPVALYATLAEPAVIASDQPANQPSFISHEDTPNEHYAHDWNMELVPDPDYQWVLGTANFNATPGHANYASLECEWETQNNGFPFVGSYGHGNIGMPLWVTPSAGDQIYIVGRWPMDNGHPDTGDRTELHPVRMLATTRQRNTVVPFASGGCVTRASQTDIYVSGHGGGANKFPDQLSVVTNNNGLGGGRIENVLSSSTLPVYFAFGPANSIEADLITSLLGGDDDLIKKVAGPSAFGWTAGPEERPVNDMDYDFDVLLPIAPPGATQPHVRVTQHAEHTTAVNQVITYTTPDETGLPTIAHIHLPYHGADSRIYARTLKFYWDKVNPPGRHFVVKMNNITFFLPQKMSGRTYLWTDICGQWVFLTERDQAGFLHAKDTLTGDLQNLPPFNVYIDPGQKVRVFTQGYDQEEFDSLFGVDVGKTAYQAAIDLANATIAAELKNPLDPEDGENEDLGGALFEHAPLPTGQLAGGILGHHTASAGYFVVDFNVSYVPNPHIDVTDVPVDFGQTTIGTSVDRVIRINNAAVGIGNNDAGANAGVDTLTNQLSLSGAGFSLVPANFPNPISVDAGQHQDITVRFTPTNASQGAGTLTINSNDSCQPTRVVSLSATVLAPQISATAAQGNLFPPTVVGCMNSKVVTVSNTGTTTLIVSPAIVAAGYSLNPFLSSGTDGIHLAPGTSVNLTVNFAPTMLGNDLRGQLIFRSNDPVSPTSAINFCGDGTPTGIRVLVLQANGVPYQNVDQIMLKGKSLEVNMNLRNVPLTVINSEDCGITQFHYETALPLSERDRKNRLSTYTLHVKVGRKSRTVTFTLEDCQFQPIVVTL